MGLDSALARQNVSLIDEDYFFYRPCILSPHLEMSSSRYCGIVMLDKLTNEYASQLNMYLNYFKAEVMQPDDKHKFLRKVGIISQTIQKIH